jgi:phage regulator Rha-like protein
MVKSLQKITQQGIERLILLVRGQKVLLDMYVAALYGTTTKNLNRAIKRNQDRFPPDFMFQLSDQEFADLKYHFGTSKSQGGRRYAPFAFTEHGIIMAASVLNSSRAIEVSVLVVRTFIKLRRIISAHKELAHKLTELERKVGHHDETIESLIAAIRRLMDQTSTDKKGKIGFARAAEK